MKVVLKKNGYVFNDTTQIWARPDYSSIDYNDGDEAENRLQHILNTTKDLSVLSQELSSHCTDWASLYHLSRNRANLIRPFKDIIKGDILEIGSGCGAITRYLGECGANVLALEGSNRRASITRARTRDLENVTVLAEKFDAFSCDQKFDVITLIGVLEYARKFFPGGELDPVDALLNYAKSFLKPDGVLIVAIENQLGLKYFAGANEDHFGQPMYGIEDLYTNDSIVTFGKKELTERIKKAGFNHHKCWYPFPDYKLPTLVISDEMTKHSNMDLMALLSSSSIVDVQLPEHPLFFMERAWLPLSRNDLIGDLSHSFVILASPSHEEKLQNRGLGYHFATSRRKCFAKQVVFEGTQDKIGMIRQESLHPAEPVDTTLPLSMNLTDSSYVYGQNWDTKLKLILTTPGWSFDDLKEWASVYLSFLFSKIGVSHKDKELDPSTNIDGSFIDLLPRNMIVMPNGEITLIDQEWKLKSSIEIGYLIFRALYFSFLNYRKAAMPAPETPLGIFIIFSKILEEFGIDVSEADIVKYCKQEEEFLNYACGNIESINPERWINLCIDIKPLIDFASTSELKQNISERDQLINSLHQLGQEREQQLHFLNQSIVEKDTQISSLNQFMVEKDTQISSLNQFMVEKDTQISSLNQFMVEKDTQISSLNQFMTEKDVQISSLNQIMQEKDQQLNVIQSHLNSVLAENIAIRGSRTWRILTFIGRIKQKVMSSPKTYMRRQISRSTRYVWNSLPLSVRNKQRLKNIIFRFLRIKKIETNLNCSFLITNKWCIITTQHTQFIAFIIEKSLKEKGFHVEILSIPPEHFYHDFYIVICPQMFKQLPPGEKRIVFQMEQSVSSRWFTTDYLDVLNNSFAVLEYSRTNLNYLNSKKIKYPHVHYVPIGAACNYVQNESKVIKKKYDVLFYGDSNSSVRRQEMLISLKNHFEVHIVNDVFGDEMKILIQQARVVVNIHYYENALLETTRISECISLSVPVVSESAVDQFDYPDLVNSVTFFEQGSIPKMIEAVQNVLRNPPKTEEIYNSVELSSKRFEFMFTRFLVAINVIPESSLNQFCDYIKIKTNNSIAVSLPETIERRVSFEEIKPRDCLIFDGIRKTPGWLGCGLSYSFLAKNALKQNVKQITIMEDDVLLPLNYLDRLKIINEYLESKGSDWDIFSGLMASIREDVKIFDVEEFNGITFVTMNRIVSTVFNIYNERALNILSSWDSQNLDATSNTIDRYMENHSDLKIVTTIPFLVDHKDELHSTLWHFNNSVYNSMILDAEKRLSDLVLAYKKQI